MKIVVSLSLQKDTGSLALQCRYHIISCITGGGLAFGFNVRDPIQFLYQNIQIQHIGGVDADIFDHTVIAIIMVSFEYEVLKFPDATKIWT